jgi:hypothetical protein
MNSLQNINIYSQGVTYVVSVTKKNSKYFAHLGYSNEITLSAWGDSPKEAIEDVIVLLLKENKK